MDCEEIRAAGTIADEGLRRRHVGDVTDSKTNNVSHQPRFMSGGKSRVYEQVKGVEQRSMSAKVGSSVLMVLANCFLTILVVVASAVIYDFDGSAWQRIRPCATIGLPTVL